ncbi:MAG: tRNA (guanosine(46)-N7)-methyltransferase TrmB [Treponema sp.]|jgi:tRNA (guanine-N7-)-methyltransferase|nr:tRNA (guanosine(46)-N7)-methyltransferase TrmB [Treponema sp.]
MEHIKSFVLRSGRMSRAQTRAYEEGGAFRIPYTGAPADFAAAFGNNKPLTVEIGFGMGRATAEIAGANPEKNYLGIEVFRAGVGRLIWEIKNRGLDNLRIIEHDAVDVLETMLPPGAAAAFHIFFPDPWPKKRHRKRRLVRRPLTDLLASRLCPGGYIYMVTDWEDYGNSALEELTATPGLCNPPGGFAPGQAWRPRTKFEKKGLDEGRPIRELYFVRR